MLRNVKSRVDTSSPRSWARVSSPVMCQSEKTFRKRSIQDIRKRFKNALNFSKKTKNNPPASSPIANSARFKDVSAETMHLKSNIPQEIYHSHHPPLAVQPFAIRSSFASNTLKDPNACQHICLHHKPSVFKTPDKGVVLNNQCQHTCLIHIPKKKQIEQPTFKNKHRMKTETHRNQNSESKLLPNNKYGFLKYGYYGSKYHLEPRCGDVARTKVNVTENNPEVNKNEDCVFLEKHQSLEKFDAKPLNDKIDSRVELAETVTQRSSKEQEYLMFLLRITEDIIVNDFYSKDDIKNIFERHIEANKTHLDYKRMLYHISNLCRELNIKCDNYSKFEFQNQFESHRESKGAFDRSIFQNCKRCTNLPIKPKFIVNNNEESFENHRNILPDELAEKLSLGRVTECTEPIPSTSTLNTPKIIEINTILDVERLESIEKVYQNKDYSETCFEEKEQTYEFNESENLSSFDITSSQTFKFDSKTNNLVTKNCQENALDTNSKQKIDFYINMDYQEHTSSLENSENSLQDLSKRPEKKFRELSLDEVWSNTKSLVNKANINQEDNQTINEEKLDSNTSTKNTKLVLTIEYFSKNPEQSENQSKNMFSQENNVKEQDLSSTKNQECEYNIKTDFLQSEYEEAKQIEANITGILKELTAKTIKECEQKNDVIDIFRASQQNIDTFIPDSDSSKSDCQNQILSSIESVKKHTNAVFTTQEQEHFIKKDKRDCTIKVCIEGSPKEGDYIYLKGPIYVLKALLNVQPQLIIVQEELDNEHNTRHESTDSLASNKTYTITNPTTEEFDIKFEEELGLQVKDIPSGGKNVKNANSLGNQFAENVEFLKKPNDTYNLSFSDYDLTPEKEYTDKYHNLLVDVTTSMPTIFPIKQFNSNNDSQLINKWVTDIPKYDSQLENILNIKPDEVILLTEHYEQSFKNTILDENVTPESGYLYPNDSKSNLDQDCKTVFDTVLNELISKCGSFHKSNEVKKVSSGENRKLLNEDKQVKNITGETLGKNRKYITSEEQELNDKNSDLSVKIYKDTPNKLVSLAERVKDFQDNDKEMCPGKKNSKANQKSLINLHVSNTDARPNGSWKTQNTVKKNILDSPGSTNEHNVNITQFLTCATNKMAENLNLECQIDRLEITGSNEVDNVEPIYNFDIQSKEQNVSNITEVLEHVSINKAVENIQNNIQTQDRLKISRSEINSSKLFRMRNVFESQRSLSADSSYVAGTKNN